MPDNDDDTAQNHVEWNAVEEGFRLLERDLGKLQVYNSGQIPSAYAKQALSAIHRN